MKWFPIDCTKRILLFYWLFFIMDLDNIKKPKQKTDIVLFQNVLYTYKYKWIGLKVIYLYQKWIHIYLPQYNKSKIYRKKVRIDAAGLKSNYVCCMYLCIYFWLRTQYPPPRPPIPSINVSKYYLWFYDVFVIRSKYFGYIPLWNAIRSQILLCFTQNIKLNSHINLKYRVLRITESRKFKYKLTYVW